MGTQNTISITQNTLILAFLGSTVVATVIGLLLNWLKEFFQKKREREEVEYEELYGALTYHLLAMKVLTDNKTNLIEEINKEPGNIQMKNEALRTEPGPLIEQWHEHRNLIKYAFQNNPGYIKKEHIKLVEDFLDGCVKWDIAKGGQSQRATPQRMDKLIRAIGGLQKNLLP